MSPTSSRRSDAGARAALSAAALLALGACSLPPRAPPEDPARELAAVPFFPQTLHHCGPAALATVLAWSGAAATPESLAPQVYLPGRRGSLQVELAAAARRAGRVPWELAPGEAALRAELAAGTPVLVLQDFGVAGLRRWHYAVIVGFDAAGDAVLLRSGTERRRAERRTAFLRSWDRAGRWALAVLPPDRLPATATPGATVRGLEAAAPFLPPGTAASGYATALARWPADPAVLFGAANLAAGDGRAAEAEGLYRRLLAVEPRHAAGRNNFASLLLARGCAAAATDEARAALADLAGDAGAPPAFRAAIEDTLRRAQAARPRTAAGC